MRSWTPSVVFVALVAGCAHVPRATQNGELLRVWPQISDRDYIRVRGVGSPNARARGLTRRRAEARDAALVMARKELLSVVHGVRISGGVTIQQLAERDSLFRELTDAIVKGGDEVLCEWTSTDDAVVTLELRRSTAERLIQKKTQHETDLEQRVARDVDEINLLNQSLDEVAAERLALDRTAQTEDFRSWGWTPTFQAQREHLDNRLIAHSVFRDVMASGSMRTFPGLESDEMARTVKSQINIGVQKQRSEENLLELNREFYCRQHWQEQVAGCPTEKQKYRWSHYGVW